MSNNKPVDQTQKAREDVKDDVYDPPHSGVIRDTVLGSSYSSKEKRERAEYKYAREREKKRRNK